MIHELVFLCFALVTDWSYANKTDGDTCFDEFTKTEGRCIMMQQCLSAKIDIEKHSIQPTPCENPENSSLVCCRDPPATTTTRTKRSIKEPGEISKKKCEEYTNAITQTVYGSSLSLHPVTQAYTSVKCIYRGAGLIIGGVPAKQGEFPHMVAVGWRTENGTYTFDCGGTLIDKRFVLTAGHCTRFSRAENGKPEVVRLGDQNLNPNVMDGANDVQVRISNIYIHPGYKYSKKYNDIALLELESEVKFNDDIRPACLWTNEDFGDNKNVLATGWGIMNTVNSTRSNELLMVALKILDNSECNVTLADNINRKWAHGFDETQMCAGGDGQIKDTCQGDSGGPLQVVSKENHCIYTVLGITSFGAKFCGKPPSVYTKVSSYLEWIESIVWPSEEI